MIRAPDVDYLVEAAIELVHVIGDVGREISGLAVVTAQYAVFFVAKIAGAEPLRAILQIDVPVVVEPAYRGIDQTLVGQRTLGEPTVEVDAKGVQVSANHFHQRVERSVENHAVIALAEQSTSLFDQFVDMLFLVTGGRVGTHAVVHPVGGLQEALTVFTVQGGGDIPDVVSLVGVARKSDLLAAQLEVAQPGRGTEDMHLPAGVVDVILALHRVAGVLQQVGERGAVGGTAAVTDVQRPGGIGGNEFDLDAAALPELTAAEAITGFEDSADHRLTGAAGQEKIDEPGPGHLHPLDGVGRRQAVDDGLRQLARRLPGVPGQHQRDIRREIALAGILRRRHLDIGIETDGNLRSLLERSQCLRDQI